VALLDSSGSKSAEQLVQVNVVEVSEAPSFVLVDPVLAGQGQGYQVTTYLGSPEQLSWPYISFTRFVLHTDRLN
jgi:hypothetical protein